jgi:hypothetical protein
VVASEIKKWSDNVLADFEKSNAVLTESFFEDINDADNGINLLLGSRIFTEGWDSNRPNVINFINIGVNDEARKFVLQTTGRGVRIEPVKNQRNRLKYIKDKKAIARLLSSEEQKTILNNKMQVPVESLFIFATDKEVITNVIDGLNTSRSGDKWSNVPGVEKNDIPEDLLIPVYKDESEYQPPAYQISEKNFNELLGYIGKEPGAQDKTHLMKVPDRVTGTLLTTLDNVRNKKNIVDQPKQSDYNHPFQELLAIDAHLNQKPKRIETYKPVTNEIKHFEQIQARNIDETTLHDLEEKLYAVLHTTYESKDELYDALKAGEIDPDQFELNLDVLKESDFKSETHAININKDFLKEHYYRPILLAQKGFENAYRHIVKHKSEIEFVKKLSEEAGDGLFDEYNWWYFSKLEENVDDIAIPYFDTKEQKYREFFPDFIFWLKKDNTLYITFVDPKGPEHQTNPTDKIKGFQSVIEQHENLEIDDCEVVASLWFYNEDIRTRIEKEYRENYWTNDLEKIFG